MTESQIALRGPFLTPAEVAESLRVHVNTVYLLINTGQLPATRVGAQYRINPTDVVAYLEARRVAGLVDAVPQRVTATGGR